MKKASLQSELRSNGGHHKHISHSGIDPGDKLMMGPDNEREPSGSKGVENSAITKQFLPGKNGYDFSYDTHGR